MEGLSRVKWKVDNYRDLIKVVFWIVQSEVRRGNLRRGTFLILVGGVGINRPHIVH